MTSNRSYSGAGAPTTLVANLNNSSLSFQVAATTNWPNTSVGPFVIEVGYGEGSAEKMLIDSYDGSGNLTVDPAGRGYDGTTQQSHNAGDPVVLVWDAASAQDANLHIYSTSRDDHSQYNNNARHDVTARHAFGAALGSPAAPTSMVGATSSAAGTTSHPPAIDNHQHAGIPTPASDGLLLVSKAAASNGIVWSASGITTKGDLLVGGATGAAVRLPVGTNGYVLTADSTQTDGVAWEAPYTFSGVVGIVTQETVAPGGNSTLATVTATASGVWATEILIAYINTNVAGLTSGSLHLLHNGSLIREYHVTLGANGANVDEQFVSACPMISLNSGDTLSITGACDAGSAASITWAYNAAAGLQDAFNITQMA